MDNTTAKPKLALNEACEQKHLLSGSVMQPFSACIIFLGVLYASWSLVALARGCGFKSWAFNIPFHACLAQLLYHIFHVYIHAQVDMSYVETQELFNPLFVFFFAHQAGTLGAFYFGDWKKGFVAPFALVVGAFLSTGMIYPTIWTYLPLVAWFRSKLGWHAVLASFLTLGLTGMEVRFCNVERIRFGTSYADAIPFHVFADSGQTLSIFIQCWGLVKFAEQAAAKK